MWNYTLASCLGWVGGSALGSEGAPQQGWSSHHFLASRDRARAVWRGGGGPGSLTPHQTLPAPSSDGIRPHSFGRRTRDRIGRRRNRRKVLWCRSWEEGVARLLVSMQVVLVIRAHPRVGVVPAWVRRLTRVKASHHACIVWTARRDDGWRAERFLELFLLLPIFCSPVLEPHLYSRLV